MFKSRCHNAANLLSQPRAKAAKEAGELGETAQKQVIEIYLEEKYGFKKPDIESKYLEKGLLMEDESIALLSQVDDEFYLKNDERKENEYLTGECDIITDDKVFDIKTSWDLLTFATAKMTKLYETQLRCYMELYDVDEAYLVYCLHSPTPEMIEAEKTRIHYKYLKSNPEYEEDEVAYADYEKACEEMEHSLTAPDRMTERARVKVLGPIYRDADETQKIYDAIDRSRIFYEGLDI